MILRVLGLVLWASVSFAQTFASPTQVTGSVQLQRATGSASLTFAAPVANACAADQTITATGSLVGDVVALGIPSSAISAGAIFFAYVSAADTVAVRYCCANGASACAVVTTKTFTVRVFQ